LDGLLCSNNGLQFLMQRAETFLLDINDIVARCPGGQARQAKFGCQVGPFDFGFDAGYFTVCHKTVILSSLLLLPCLDGSKMRRL
jgi:hypothetical protein